MMTKPIPNCLLLDEIFSQLGPEGFPAEWTGEEGKLVMDLPLDYWHPLDTLVELVAWFQPQDWLSEDYVNRYANEEAVKRYKQVADWIIHKYREGEYCVFLTYANGYWTKLDIGKINSEQFKQLIYHPKASDRIRLRFRLNTKSAELPDDPRENGSGVKADTNRSEPAKRALRVLETKQMHSTWLALAEEYRITNPIGKYVTL